MDCVKFKVNGVEFSGKSDYNWNKVFFLHFIVYCKYNTIYITKKQLLRRKCYKITYIFAQAKIFPDLVIWSMTSCENCNVLSIVFFHCSSNLILLLFILVINWIIVIFLLNYFLYAVLSLELTAYDHKALRSNTG